MMDRRAAGRWTRLRDPQDRLESIEMFVAAQGRSTGTTLRAAAVHPRNVEVAAPLPRHVVVRGDGPLDRTAGGTSRARDQEATTFLNGPKASWGLALTSTALEINPLFLPSRFCSFTDTVPTGENASRSRLARRRHDGSLAHARFGRSARPRPSRRRVQPPRRANPLPMRTFDPQRLKSPPPGARLARSLRGSDVRLQAAAHVERRQPADDVVADDAAAFAAVQGDGNFGSCAKKLAACWHVCPRAHSRSARCGARWCRRT